MDVHEYAAPPEWFHFGGSHWTYSDNVGFFLDPAGNVIGRLKNGERVGQWPDFESFFADELARAERIFPQNEANFAALLQRYRDAPKAPTNWFKRLFSRR